MTDKEIIKALECCLSGKEELCKECPFNGECYGDVEYLIAYALGLINRQQEQLEVAIAGQESLQKALAEKDREVAELNSDLKLLKNDYDCLKANFDETVEKNKRLRDKVVGLTAEKDRLIKTFGECQAEVVRDFAERLKAELSFGKYVQADHIDNLVKEMTNKESSNIINSDSRQTEINNKAHSSVRSFAEKLKYQLSLGLENKIPANVYSFVYCTVDNLVKEMVGDTNG